MPYLDIATGARLEYVDAGSGPPLVALHGLAGTARRHLGRIIDWLSADDADPGPFRVLAPNLRGYGGSTPKPRDFPPDFYRRDAGDVLAFLDALGIDRAHLMGYSDGGEVALIAAGLQPARFRSVIVWGASGYFSPALGQALSAPGYRESLMPTPTVMTLHGILDGEAFAQGWIDAVRGLVEAGGDVSLSLAARITAPLLMMMGRQDHLNFAADARRVAERAPDGRLELFDCGHAIHEAAWDDFQRVVRDFLRRVGDH